MLIIFVGKLYFRSYSMPISVPLMIEDNKNLDIKNKYDLLSVSNLLIEESLKESLRKIVNNCIDFRFIK